MLGRNVNWATRGKREMVVKGTCRGGQGGFVNKKHSTVGVQKAWKK